MKNRWITKQQWLYAWVLSIGAVFLFPSWTYAVDFKTAWTEFMEEYQVVYGGILGLGVLTSILGFVVNFVKIGKPGDPQGRKEGIRGVLISMGTLMGFGAIGLVSWLIYYIANGS